jgi:LPS sulfotransferase NodH
MASEVIEATQETDKPLVVRRRHEFLLLVRAQVTTAASILRAQLVSRPRVLPTVVVLSHGRSGSSMLVDLLNCHPQVHCDSEVLSHRLFTATPRALLRSRARLFATQAYGFKLRPNHFAVQRIGDPQAFVADLAREGWRFVHLVRRNVVRVALSVLRMKRTGVFHRLGSVAGDADTRVAVPPDALLACIAQIEDDMRIEAACLAGIPHLELAYEEDLLRASSQQAALDRTFAFLGLPPAAVATQYVRLTSDRISDFVVNYDEVAVALAETPYAHFLEAD